MKLSYRIISLSSAAVLALTNAASALPSKTTLLPRSAARDFGALNAAQRISVTVHLKRPNEALFTKTVDALYDHNSPTFHHWLTDAQLAQFSPTIAQVAAVRTELARNGLSIVSIAGDRSSIRAVGTVAAMSQTFHTSIHQYSLNGTAFRAPTSPAALAGVAGSYVAVVSGLESHPVKTMLAHAFNVKTKAPLAPIPLSKALAAGGLSALITDEIFGPKKTFSYTTGGALPTAKYTGYTYDPNPNTNLIPDYTPKQLQDALGLTAAYKKGLNGAGQTIVLLEGYGYPNMLADANAFSKLTGLPPLNASNFAVAYPEGAPNPQAGYLTGWSTEISLDIDWAHSIAPGAKIVVVATNGQDSQDFEASMQYIVDNHVGNVVSDSWEEDIDFLSGPAEQEPFEYVLTAAAAKGISFQFSTGDSGDGGLGTPVGAAGVPSVAPHATAVGGTAIGNIPGKNSYINLGWGDGFSYIDSGGPIQPGTLSFFVFGGGGGSSTFWPKPAWQAALPGFYRQTPDVSALADPFTGVPFVTTDFFAPGQPQVVQVGEGGTSLASPIFTAMWAIANQRAGHSLGFAAPTIAGLKSGIIDVLPTTVPFSGSYTTSSGTTTYTANSLFASLAQGLNTTQNVLATIWDQPEYSDAIATAFGLDTSLTVTPGWDNATGYGTPYGLAFINAAATY